MADPKVQRKVRDQDADGRRSRGSEQAAPDPQQNGTMEFPRVSDRNRIAPCERGNQSFGTRRCQSSLYVRSAAKEETKVEDSEDSIDSELEHGETTMFLRRARLNYLSQDLSVITFAFIKLCSKMSRPHA